MGQSDQTPDTVSGIVTNIQRFSIHDGPGIRTTVFFKGCNLRCFWCHNPETWRPRPELQVYPDKCIGCGACLSVCPENAHVMVDGEKVFLRDRCTACGACADQCYAEALVMVGEEMTVDDVMDEVLADRAFYKNSGGGVTLSGGEPALQLDFAYAILAASKAEGIHTAIETDANYSWARLERLLEVTDLVMTDIKHMDSETHRRVTGVPTERIHANHRRLMATDQSVIFHTPVIPSVNATVEQMGAIAAYVRELADLRAKSGSDAPPPRLELLPFHKLAADKYRSLDMQYEAIDLAPPTQEEMEAFVKAAEAYDILVHSR